MKRTALITGANRGIGLETARQLAALGLHVILGSRDPFRGEAAAAQLLAEGGEYFSTLALDVTDQQQIAAAGEFIESRFGQLDVLVNNAAIYPDEGVSVFDVPLETLQETLEVNFYGPFNLCRQFLPGMRRAGYGRVVNVSSTSGQLSNMGGRTAAYRISKTALNALTRILADELKSTNVKVNAVCPGWVRSKMGGAAAPRSPAEGADTIVWLATLPNDGPSGRFFRDRKAIPW